MSAVERKDRAMDSGQKAASVRGGQAAASRTRNQAKVLPHEVLGFLTFQSKGGKVTPFLGVFF